jgi:hypothetical protein
MDKARKRISDNLKIFFCSLIKAVADKERVRAE